jgi:hypothetical protein
MRQTALPLDKLRANGSDSLIVTPSNAPVFSSLGNHAAWPGHCAILIGPPRSGKSLMARYFEGQGGDTVDDAETVPDEALFHRWNDALSSGHSLLLLSRHAPSEWNIALPDLRSRVAASQLLTISAPDEDLMTQLLLKHLHDRGTSIGPEALGYVVKRIERSHAAVEDFARDVNAAALAQGSAITLSLVRTVLTTGPNAA